MAEKLVRPLAIGGVYGEQKGPEIALNANPDAVEDAINRLEPRLQSITINAIRRRLDKMQGITGEETRSSSE
jgi:hypothetical protein